MNPADTPLRRDTLALVGVLMQTLEPCQAYRPLIDRMSQRGLDLVEAVAQALAGVDREERLIDADAALQSLRTLLRMARHLDLLDDDGLVEFCDQADRVGRQLGGWLRQLTGAR